MTGVDLAQNILRLRPDIPIILCTGFSHVISKDKAEELGIREFVLKPVEIAEIAAIVRRLLDQSAG